ncbi:hypothetical protein BGZ90_000316 [Linnemannia elongata]|nr:hypothetical protein BGZ90_000316 [Linnemannia elongata]
MQGFVNEFTADSLKSTEAIFKVLLIAPCLDEKYYRMLLSCVFDEFKASTLLSIDQLQGLVQLIENASQSAWIAGAVEDDSIRLWSLQTGAEELVSHPAAVELYLQAWTWSGHRLAVVNRIGNIWLFDPQSKELIMSKSIDRGRIDVITFSPNGQQLAIGDEYGWIYLQGLQPDDCDIMQTLYMDHVICIAYSPCGEWLASGSGSQMVRLWRRRQPPGDTESWSYVSTVRGFVSMVLDIAWSPTVPMEFVTGCADESVRVWRVSSDGEDVVVKLLWGTNLAVLHADGLVLKGTVGLGLMQKKLLVQRSAIADSLTLDEVGGLGVEE